MTYVNGQSIKFKAQECNFDPDGFASNEGHFVKYMYKDQNGEETPLYLDLRNVAGIVVFPT